jgi:predicted lipoprotein with Yx(FWY)xxD motif
MYQPNHKTRSISLISVLVMLVLVLAACSPNASPAQPTATTEPITIQSTAIASPVTLKVSQNATLGSFLTDQNGMTLYSYSNDTNGVSTCTGACQTNWPPVLTTGTPVAGDPSINGQLGVTSRTDGSQQVTYNGAPLYYFIKDMKAGDTNGQGVGSVWYVVPSSPAASVTATTTSATATTMSVTATTTSATATSAPTTAAVATPSGPATVKVSQNNTLGSFLVDQNGMTLYIFTNDSAGVSTCSGGCQTNWPPFLTNGAPVTGDPSINGKLGVIIRSDGSQQVTINNMPLYYYSKDIAAGDTNGQGIGSVWFVVQPSGTPMQ